MSPAILATSAVALIAAAGITVKVIHDNDQKTDNNVAVVSKQVEPSYAAITPPEPPANTPQPASSEFITDGDRPGTETTKTTNPSIRVFTSDDGTVTSAIMTGNVRVIALKADDDIFASLGLEPEAVQNICTGLESADKMTNCSEGSAEGQVKVCMVKDGNTDEVVLMDRRGPMPVMFTSADGRGHVVQSKSTVGVDPNKLVPVAAEGCGENVLMWFQPTEEFVYSMPEGLGDELNEFLEFQVNIREVDGGKMIVTTKSKDGEVTTEVIKNSNDDGREIRPNSACRVPATKDELDAIFNLDDILKMKSNDGQFVIVNNNQKNIDIDSILREANIEIDQEMKTVDGKTKAVFVSKTVTISDTSMPNNLWVQHDGDAKMPSEIRIRKVMTSDSDGNYTIEVNEEVDFEVHKMVFRSSPNVSSRCVILTSKNNNVKVDTDADVPNTSLQETRLRQGAIFAPSVYPNPTNTGDAQMEFNLSEPRAVSMNLLNLNGETVKEVARNVSYPAGRQKISFGTNGVPAGMYLVAVTTNEGEQIVSRLIVQ